MRRTGLFFVCLVLAAAAAAQQAAGPQAATQAAHLPLSGKSPQAGSVTASQSSSPAGGINTLAPQVQASASFAGSVSAQAPFTGKLSLAEAIARGLAYNLGPTQWANTVRQAEGESRVARSALLPNLNSSLNENIEQLDLATTGFHLSLPPAVAASGFSVPTIVGPFSYMELQASLTQSLFNLTAWNNYRAAQATLQANQLALRDARDQVVLGVGGAYLAVIAAQARLQAAQAELQTANAILQQSQEKKSAGTVPQLTVDQNQVQASIQQLQLTTLANEVAKQKINLARMIGLPPGQNYQVTDEVPYAPLPPLTGAAATQQALAQRADLQEAAVEVTAARDEVTAARDERMPTVSVSGSYGVIGKTVWNNSHGVFTVAGSINLPLWQGGRAGGDLEQAQATLAQRQAEETDLRGQIEAQVRSVFLDLSAAAEQVKVAHTNLRVAHEALQLTQDRFSAGVINTVELVQAQQQVATAEQDYINSVYAYNVAKLTLARVLGDAPGLWAKFLPGS